MQQDVRRRFVPEKFAYHDAAADQPPSLVQMARAAARARKLNHPSYLSGCEATPAVFGQCDFPDTLLQLSVGQHKHFHWVVALEPLHDGFHPELHAAVGRGEGGRDHRGRKDVVATSETALHEFCFMGAFHSTAGQAIVPNGFIGVWARETRGIFNDFDFANFGGCSADDSPQTFDPIESVVRVVTLEPGWLDGGWASVHVLKN